MKNRISEFRRMYGLSQTELAKELHIAQNTLSQYETGARNPTSRTLLKMAEMFDVSVNDILGVQIPDASDKNPQDFSLTHVTKVRQTTSTDEVNIYLGIGWKLLHIGSYTNSRGEAEDTVFTLGWYGDPKDDSSAFTPGDPDSEFGWQL